MRELVISVEPSHPPPTTVVLRLGRDRSKIFHTVVISGNDLTTVDAVCVTSRNR